MYYRQRQLRFLFANLIADLPIGPIQVWERFREHLVRDFAQINPRSAIDKALHEIAQHLRGRGMTLEQVGLLVRASILTETQVELHLFAPRLREFRQKASQRRSTFNHEQESVFQTLIAAYDSSESVRPMFLDGKAGGGKSYVVECLTWFLRSQEHIIIVTGSTALSIIANDRGCTAHSAFGIPVKDNSSDISCRI